MGVIKMVKVRVDDGTKRGSQIELERIEIVTDTAKPDKVEIYFLDDAGDRIEGGEFSRSLFMDVILKFYHEQF
jgi:hypothetical protein